MPAAVALPSGDRVFSLAVCQRINRRIQEEQQRVDPERHWLPSPVEQILPLTLYYEYLVPRLPYFRSMLLEGGPVVYPDAQSTNDHSWYSIDPAVHILRARRQLSRQRQLQQAVVQRAGGRWVDFDEDLIGWPYHSRQWVLWGRPETSASLHKSLYYSLLSQLVDLSKVSTVLDIGGGFGSLLSTVLTANARMCGYLVELPRLCFVAEYYLRRKLGDVALLHEDVPVDQARVSVVLPWMFDQLTTVPDLAINTQSFQHMAQANQEFYFSNLARLGVKQLFSVNREQATREGEAAFLPTARKHGYRLEKTLSLEPWSSRHPVHLLVLDS